LNSGKRYVISIAIDTFFLRTTPLGCKVMLSERTLLWKRDRCQEIIEELNNLKISDGGEEFEGYGKEHNWAHKCGLWELPYSKALILIHNIVVKHQERNVAKSIVMMCMNFLEKSKDNKPARKDLL
jgi:hypothetical protein